MSNSILITYKPSTENKSQGWPPELLRALAKRVLEEGSAIESWRVSNMKIPQVGDTAYLLLQGKQGPAIIGKGVLADKVKYGADGARRAPVKFTSLIDPSEGVFIATEELQSIPGGETWWRSNSSGVCLPDEIAQSLEQLFDGDSVKPPLLLEKANTKSSNPDWTRDELILALDFYLNHRKSIPGHTSPAIIELSATLKSLGKLLFSDDKRGATFRNENGVYMKLMNFRRLDPLFTSTGKKGLPAGSVAEEEVWNTFAADPEKCARVAAAIKQSINDSNTSSTFYFDEDEEEAPEGKLLTRLHKSRERRRDLVEKKKKKELKENGRLSCAACKFDFWKAYGERGKGFIECHHVIPVSSLAEEGETTKLKDLVLLCANCHRMVHRGKPWLSIAEVMNLLQNAAGIDNRSTAPSSS